MAPEKVPQKHKLRLKTRTMTCQHCQTWILDEDHRCHRCGRRVRNGPQRISPTSFPIAAAATAVDYSAFEEPSAALASADPVAADLHIPVEQQQQHVLFRNMASDGRVIPFDSLTTRTERQSIRARMAGLERPTPLKTGKVEVRRARKAQSKSSSQRHLEFLGHDETTLPSRSEIICDAMVAPAALRLRAALIDLFVMVVPMVAGIALFFYAGGEVSTEKHILPFFLLALATIPAFYKLLWTVAGSDTIGMKAAGLVLVDFDGNPPSKARRYLRCAGSALSFLAAGIGTVWLFLDEDRLTWHDHISSTFPTVMEN